MFKKLISVTILSVMLICNFSFNSFALEIGDFSVEYSNGNAVITSYNGYDSELTVPETINGYKVTEIGEAAFINSSLKSVELPDTLISIDESAFANSALLTSVKLGSSLYSIGDTAFYNCAKLNSEIRFPDSLRKIGESAFEDCWDMTYAVIPAGVESIGYCAFGCYYDEEKSEDNSNNKYYDYKRSDFRIFGYENTAAEDYCTRHKFDFYDLNKGYNAVSYKGMDFFIDADNSASLTSYNDISSDLKIPETVNGYTVTSIGDYAMFGSSVKSVSIPKTITEIGVWAFESCDNLKSINVPPTVTTVKEGALGYYYEDGFNRPYLDFKICGAPNSGAKEYADIYEFEFEDVYTTFLTLSKSSGSVYVKGTLNVNAKVKNGVGKTVFKSSDNKIAAVNSYGKITGKKAGKAVITVENNGVKKSFKISVKNPKLSKTKVKIKAGKLYSLKIIGQVGKAKFTSSNSSIVKVNASTGKFKGLRSGTAYINVKTNGIKLKCKVDVRI